MTLHSIFTSSLCVPLLLLVHVLGEAAPRRRGREQLLDLGCLEAGHLQPIRGDHPLTWPRTDQSQLTCRLPRLLRPLCLAAESPGSTDTGYPTTWRVDNTIYRIYTVHYYLFIYLTYSACPHQTKDTLIKFICIWWTPAPLLAAMIDINESDKTTMTTIYLRSGPLIFIYIYHLHSTLDTGIVRA